jgi:hypothetical protein
MPDLLCQNRLCPAANFYFWPLYFKKNVDEGGLKIFFQEIKENGWKIFSDINQLN